MRITPATKTAGMFFAIVLAICASSGTARADSCCECLKCPAEVSACSADSDLDRRTYEAQVCKPLGCLTATCIQRACSRGNRCPADEGGQCSDGFDNDADGLADGADSDCPGGPGTGSASDCCIGRDQGTGCSDADCQACVCGRDNFCCNAIWDVNCAIQAKDACPTECQCETATVPLPTATEPGQTVPQETATPVACTSDGDCGSQGTCKSGVCVAAETPTPTPAGCTDDRDCSGGQSCKAGTCSGPGSATTTPSACGTDNDCPRGETCASGSCSRETSETPVSSGGSGGGGGGCSVASPQRGSISLLLLMLAPAVLIAARRCFR